MTLSISRYLISLFLTLIIETSVCLFFGYRKKEFLKTIVLINIITHPILHYLMLTFTLLGLGKAQSILVFLLEIVIIFVEWKLLTYVYGPDKKFLKLSAAMNLASYVAGLIIVCMCLHCSVLYCYPFNIWIH